METDCLSSSLLKSRVWVSIFPKFSSNLSWIQLIFIFTLNFPITISISTSSQTLYSHHCNTIVPKSTATELISVAGDTSLSFQSGYFTGGDTTISKSPSKSLSFHAQSLYKTETLGVYKLDATLDFLVSSDGGDSMRLRMFRNRFTFKLNGFYSNSSGNLCMVGSGLGFSNSSRSSKINVLLKLNYHGNATIYASLIHGVFENLDIGEKIDYFKPFEILGVSRNYRLIDHRECSGSDSSLSRLGLGNPAFCLSLLENPFELEYLSDCDSVNCNPLIRKLGLLPNFMYFVGAKCNEEHLVRFSLRFSNESVNRFNQKMFVPDKTLITEGVWDENKNRFCGVACRVLNFEDSLANAVIGDCSIKLSLWFPDKLTIRNMSEVVGRIWSNRSMIDSDYFGEIAFRSKGFQSRGYRRLMLPGLKYEYTMSDKVSGTCGVKKLAKRKGIEYPNGYSSDMKFGMSVRNTKGKRARGLLTPSFVDGTLFGHYPLLHSKPKFSATTVNITYGISFLGGDFMFGDEVISNKLVDISAEGTYEPDTGILCMIGCRKSMKNGSLDCEIHVNLQFPSLKSGGYIKGTIKSTREKLDPLYFDTLELTSNSVYKNQVDESIWRMDLEITMVLISNTLSCVLVGLQLFHVKKHPNVLPFISITMLVVLTLGHMIPLLLNFEAMFLVNHNRKNVFLGSGGLLEVNEVVIRMVTMIVFLLEIRLLHQTWASRSDRDKHKGLWANERNVLFFSLPLYIVGAFVSWFVHVSKTSNRRSLLSRVYHVPHKPQPSVWADLKSYAGLVLDGFLLPQIILNLFSGSIEKSLSPFFYVGTTIVRLVPHGYDLYRAHSSAWNFDYIYANPKMDFFSTAWDVIIPCCGILFVGLIYLQQRFGGCCFLPRRFRDSSVYEKVPTNNTA